MTSAPLPSPAGYGPARAGLLHWRRCLARVELGALASRLVGRSVTPALAAHEQQEAQAMAAALRRGARDMLRSAPPLATIDDDAERAAAAALAVLRGFEPAGARLVGLADAIGRAIATGRDPRRAGRTWELRRSVERRIDADAELRIAALPAFARDQEAALRRAAAELKASIEWDAPDRYGAVFGVVADRLQELGFTRARLTCLTGATKRLGIEGRIDERAQLGFVRRLAHEARAGLALLDGLEAVFAAFVTHPAVVADARSALPDIVYAHLVLPAVDTKWLEQALALHERVARRFVKRLLDAGLIAPWATRTHLPADGSRARETTLNVASGFAQSYERALRRRGAGAARSHGLALAPAELIGRARDDAVHEPMAIVFQRFEAQMVDLDREFGRFWAGKTEKNRPAGKPVQRDLIDR